MLLHLKGGLPQLWWFTVHAGAAERGQDKARAFRPGLQGPARARRQQPMQQPPRRHASTASSGTAAAALPAARCQGPTLGRRQCPPRPPLPAQQLLPCPGLLPTRETASSSKAHGAAAFCLFLPYAALLPSQTSGRLHPLPCMESWVSTKPHSGAKRTPSVQAGSALPMAKGVSPRPSGR